MRYSTKITLFGMIGLLILLTACAPVNEQTQQTSKMQVSVSIPPQAYFVERIAGELVEVNILVGAGDDPHSYEPTPRQMQAIAKSQAYFANGVEFEDAWLGKFAAANPQMQIVDTASGIDFLDEENGHGKDPHTWLSPSLVKLQAGTIADTLIRLDPDNKGTYLEGRDSFIKDIELLDDEIRQQFDSLTSKTFLTVHPSYAYLARDYGLQMIAVQVEGQEPGAGELSRIIDLADEYNLRVIFAQQAFSTRDAAILADQIGAKVVILDPLAKDWLSNMNIITSEIAVSLNGAEGQ